jgi:hypothetical protein
VILRLIKEIDYAVERLIELAQGRVQGFWCYSIEISDSTAKVKNDGAMHPFRHTISLVRMLPYHFAGRLGNVTASVCELVAEQCSRSIFFYSCIVVKVIACGLQQITFLRL